MESTPFATRVAVLKRIRTEARIWRAALTVVFVVVTVICTGLTYASYNALTQDGPTKDEFTTTLGAKLQSDVLPEIEEVSTSAVRNIDFQSHFAKLNTRTPEIADATMSQFHLLANDLPVKGEQILDDQLQSTLKERESKIRALFPSATDDQIASLMTTLTSQAHDQAGDITDTLFAPHVEALNDIVVDLNKIEHDEAPNMTGQVPTWEMVFLLSDVARADFHDVLPGKETTKKGSKQ